MSALGGIWHFGAESVDLRWLANLSNALTQHGPDGEFFYTDGPIGIVYRPFHTTAESRREQQPWISPAGNVIAWDGRLDNADVLYRDLALPASAAYSEAALALLTFDVWGKPGLARLVGDFAFSIWQPRPRRLLLARDAFAVRAMFYQVTKDRVAWSSVLAPLVLQRGMRWTLDDSYIAGYLAFPPEAEETPYREIRGVGAASWVEISPQHVNSGRFWQLEPGKSNVHCKTDADYEDVFRQLFRQAVWRRLRSDKPVLAELSGGMDSSSIVSVADELLAEQPRLAPQLDTITFYDASEPTGDERDWAKFVEARRGRAGHHLNLAELESYLPIDPDYFISVPGPTEGLFRMECEYNKIQAECGIRVVLSGRGGDEFTGGVVDPIPQLADLLVLGRWLRFGQLLKKWSAVKRRPAIDLAWQSILCLAPATVRSRWSVSAKVDTWMQPDFAELHRIGQRKARIHSDSRRLLPTQRVSVATCEYLSRHRAQDLQVIGQREIRMPFMDRDLVEFLTSIPDEQLMRPGSRRSLMRRALGAIVPPEVFNRRQKAVVVRGLMSGLAQYISATQSIGGSFEVARRGYVDDARFREAIREASMVRSDNYVGILRTIALEHFLNSSSVAFSKAGCSWAS